MHITYADKSLLADDEAAQLLMSYATVLGRTGNTDSVTVHGIGTDGNEVDATFLLNPATVLVIETANTTGGEPDNEFVVEYMRGRINELTRSFELLGDPEPSED